MAAKERNSKEKEAYQQFKKEVASGELGRLYLLCGEETYLRDHYLGQMANKLIPAGLADFNLHKIQGKDCSPKLLVQEIDALPMMSQRTMIQVWDYDLFKLGESARDELMELLNDLPDYVCLVFVYDVLEYKPDGRTKLANTLKSLGKTVRFTRQEQSDLSDWIRRRFRATGHQIDGEQCRYLTFLCGDLMTGLISEIGKIAAYAKGQSISKGDIDAVATPQLDAVVFHLTDAITSRDYDKAVTVLSELLRMGEAPIKLMAVLGKQLRQLYTARLALERREGVNYLCQLWGMRSSYPAQKLMTAAQHFDLNWCRQAVVQSAKTDLLMKSTGRKGEDLLVELILGLRQ